MTDLLTIFEAERLARGADYKVTLDDVRSFLERYVYNNAETVAVDGSVASVLWSFEIKNVPTHSLSLTLAEQSGGKIRVIGTTAAGKFLEALLSDPYADNCDFVEFPIAADGSDDFWSRLSRFFVANTDHPLITITPNALASTVYGVTEVKTIADNNEIDLINGMDRSDIGFNLFSSSESAQKAYLMGVFNGEFSGDLIASNTVTIWQAGADGDEKFYFKFDEATKEALGLAGIEFASVPDGAIQVVSQQQIREDVLPAFARGLHVALFGALMYHEGDSFLDFVGTDIGVSGISVPPTPSAEFNNLRDKLAELVTAIWTIAPNIGNCQTICC